MDNNTENIISKINSNIFFKEFTFSKNDFKSLDLKQQFEFADNVVWLDELFFIFQIKERDNKINLDDRKWYQNKVINKGVKQIKSTLSYLKSYPEILISNERGYRMNISSAKECDLIRKIIIYSPSNNFPKELRYKRFYNSSEVGLIHLFHVEDYYWICKYLLTPAEVDEYLEFRECYYLADPERSNLLPEQYLLAHFMETLDTSHVNPQYIANLQHLKCNTDLFDLSYIIENFTDGMIHDSPAKYYPIIREISKLNRAELYEFKKRLIKSIEVCEKNEFNTPYRIYVPRTGCGFVFIPLHSSKLKYWKNALDNLVKAHKYEQKAKKCIGVSISENPNKSEYLQLYWNYIESEWKYDTEIEILLRDNPPPFRSVQTKKINNRYK